MTEEPQDPGLEVKMAIAGPLMSFLIAGILGGVWYISEMTKTLVPITAILGYGALINGILGVFNLIPAFPLDGGRVFRGSLWRRSGNLIGATKLATRVSEILSLLMMFGGFILIIFTDFVDGLWIVVLGWFIKSGAETSLRQTLIGETLSGVTVNDLMTRNVYTISPDITVDQLVSDYFLVNRHQGYPVIRDGKILGVVTLQSVRAIPKDRRSLTKVEQAISHGEAAICVKPTLSALDAMHKMVKERVGRLLVMEEGSLIGIVTRGDLMRTIQTRQELGAVRQMSISAPRVQQVNFPRDQSAKCVQCGGHVPMGTRLCPQCGAPQNA